MARIWSRLIKYSKNTPFILKDYLKICVQLIVLFCSRHSVAQCALILLSLCSRSECANVCSVATRITVRLAANCCRYCNQGSSCDSFLLCCFHLNKVLVWLAQLDFSADLREGNSLSSSRPEDIYCWTLISPKFLLFFWRVFNLLLVTLKYGF